MYFLLDADNVRDKGSQRVSVCNQLPELISQKPECLGRNKNRILFNQKGVTGNPTRTQGWGKFEVPAGSIHEVIVEFAVHDLDATPQVLGILIALSVNIDSVILDHRPGFNKFDVPQQATAVISDFKNTPLTLKVAVELEVEDQLIYMLFS